MSQHAGHRAGHSAGHRRPWRRGFRSAAVALAVATAGCAGPGGAAGQDAGAPDRVPTLLRSADLRLPLDDYLPSVADADRLARAGRALLRQCMHEFGFDYVTPELGPWAGPRTWTERRYGLTDPAQARHGYWPESRAAAARGAAVRLARRRAAAPTEAEGAALTGRGARVLNGKPVPPGGCAGEAQRRLTAHDPPGADQYLAQRLTSDSFFGSQRDARVRRATQQWVSCMKAAGYDYAGPLDPPKDRRFQRAVTPLEISTAGADVACKKWTNLVGVWFTVESTQQRSLVEANRAGLDRARTAVQAELAVAAGVGA
jgi:hypothetical protein